VPSPLERTAVLSGVSSGIGRAIAERLLEDGWQVVGLSRREPDLVDSGLTWRECDLTRPAGIARAVADLERIQAIVHAAGFQATAPLGQLEHSAGDEMYAVHVSAVMRLGDALVDRLADGGRILLVGSRTASGAWGKSQYVATKAAMRGLARSWAMELAPRRITVNVIEPGPTDTAMLADPRRHTTPPSAPPLGRLVRPAEVAGLAAFLLGDEGAMVTGQHWAMCGGASL
jgi:NAD(P)-dependent dehydrogenase (short-subunit alcohol dehydrogenase family)